jgi:hypothetical protein
VLIFMKLLSGPPTPTSISSLHHVGASPLSVGVLKWFVTLPLGIRSYLSLHSGAVELQSE